MNRILLIFQDQENCRLLRDQLAESYEVVVNHSIEELKRPLDLGILDRPALTQFWKNLRARKESELPLFLPFLLVAAREEVELLTRHLRHTVDEIILTPIEPIELKTRVELLLRTRRLSLETATDPLTGIYNRRHFFALGERELKRSGRFQRPLSAIMFDLDHFKVVNDNHGHLLGDQVLRLVVARVLKCIRTIDILGRYGGEEFALLLPETDLAGAFKVAERLRQEVAQPLETEHGPLTITISLGVSTSSEEIPSLKGLINRADKALYAAKNMGRNCVMVGSEDPARERLILKK